MHNIVPEALEAYCAAHTDAPSALLRELEDYTRTHCRDAQMLTGPVEGALLRLLVEVSGAQRVLEIGTFTGYSALTMAEALPDDGQIITCELSAEHARIARSFFDRSPHGRKIDLRLGPALTTIAGLPPGSQSDIVFLDADKENYVNYYETVLPLLGPGGLLIADNTLWSGEVLKPETDLARAIVRFNQHVASDVRVTRVLLSVRDGVTVARKR